MGKKNTTYDQANGWYFGIDDTSLILAFRGSSATVASSSPIGMVTGIWYHFVAVVSGTTVSFYSNGIAKGSGTITAITNNTDSLRIGEGSNDFPSWLNAKWVLARIYNVVFTATQVAGHFNQAKHLLGI